MGKRQRFYLTKPENVFLINSFFIISYLLCIIYSCLYGINQRSCGIIRIIPSSVMKEQLMKTNVLQHISGEDIIDDQVDIIYTGDDMVQVKDKFEGGVMDLEGNIYCIPMQAKALIKIIPGQS